VSHCRFYRKEVPDEARAEVALAGHDLAEVVLVWSDLLDLADAALVVDGIEVLLFATAVGEVVLVVRRHLRDRVSDLDLWAALEEGLAVLLPRKSARIAALEPRASGSVCCAGSPAEPDPQIVSSATTNAPRWA
jgi:hypothetical protein